MPAISPSDENLEAKLASYFPEFGKDGVPPLEQFRYAESDIQEIARLLRQMGNIRGSYLPRLYIVLRTADQLPPLDALIADEMTDTWFPFPAWMLPASWDTLQKNNFTRTQSIVLTKVTDLENGDFEHHKHLDEDAAAQFRTFGILGIGSLATVEKVQIPNHRNVFYARKSISRNLSRYRNRGYLKYHENELKVLKRLDHRHIIKLIGSYTEPKALCMILSPVAEYDLWAFLSQDPLSDGQKTLLRGFFGCLSAGVAYLHLQRVVHGDIKPTNILIQGGNVLIGDFFVSNDWSGEADSMTSESWPKTLKYAAPELQENGSRGTFSDIWSLGCVFLKMLTRLRGKSLGDLAKFVAESGSNSRTFCSNLEAIALWLEVLEEVDGPIDDNIPIRWIQKMLQEDYSRRPTAIALQQMIFEAVKAPHNRFCGSCCAQTLSDGVDGSFEEIEEEKDSSHSGGLKQSSKFGQEWQSILRDDWASRGPLTVQASIATNVSEICAGIPRAFDAASQGRQENLYLTQIVAYGDQSSGKSSVLDAITGTPFPKGETLCTQFITE